MTPIEQIAREYRSPEGDRAKFLFLMPCTATPLYSHIHQNVSLRCLIRKPNLSDVKAYTNESVQFYENPAAWLQSHVPLYPKSTLPTHIVLFYMHQLKIGDFLKNYKLIYNTNSTQKFYTYTNPVDMLLFKRVDGALSNRFNQENELTSLSIKWNDEL